MSIGEQVSLAEFPVDKTNEMTRIVASSVIGTAVEWYDFLIYYGTASALVFNKLFFPLSDPALGTIAAFGTYGVGFLARPLGADRRGDEPAWWETVKLDPVAVARQLWEQTRLNGAPVHRNIGASPSASLGRELEERAQDETVRVADGPLLSGFRRL
jgi:hypothetical protein